MNFKFVQSLLYFVENYTMEEDVKKDIKVIIKDLIKIKGNIDRDYKNDLIDFFETLIRNVEQLKPNKRIYDLTQEQQQAEIVDEDERNEEKENYYTDFITSKVKNKKWLNKQTIYKIHKTPTTLLNQDQVHLQVSHHLVSLLQGWLKLASLLRDQMQGAKNHTLGYLLIL